MYKVVRRTEGLGRRRRERGGEVCGCAERSSPWGSGSSVPAQVQPVLCMDTCTKPPGWMHQGTCPLLVSCLSPRPPEPGREEAFNQMWSGRRAGLRGGAGASPSSSPTSAPWNNPAKFSLRFAPLYSLCLT